MTICTFLPQWYYLIPNSTYWQVVEHRIYGSELYSGCLELNPSSILTGCGCVTLDNNAVSSKNVFPNFSVKMNLFASVYSHDIFCSCSSTGLAHDELLVDVHGIELACCALYCHCLHACLSLTLNKKLFEGKDCISFIFIYPTMSNT